ncbi:uncharacterized protein LOC129922861 isoform X2 [Biomphalaria glabrata]|nr:uncharacterized protein LOC129922861 isoform X2 [Biomphalaria glabrata]
MASVLIVQLLTMMLFIFAWIFLILSIASPSWVVKYYRGNQNSSEGLMIRCSDTGCYRYRAASKPHLIAHWLVYIMLAIMVVNTLPNISGICVNGCRNTVIYGFSYAMAAFSGFLVLLMYPTYIKDISSAGNIQLSWGYFFFMIADCMLIALSIECFQVNTDLYPDIS